MYKALMLLKERSVYIKNRPYCRMKRRIEEADIDIAELLEKSLSGLHLFMCGSRLSRRWNRIEFIS